jgi:hypothetical protein
LKKDWKVSENNNLYVKVNDHHILIYKDRNTKKFKCKIGEHFGKKQFDTIEIAKVAAFNGIEYFKEKNQW